MQGSSGRIVLQLHGEAPFYCGVHLINRLKGGSPMNSRKPAVMEQQEHMHRQKRRAATSCSVCTRRVWFDPIYVQEPEGVPVPRACWLLCKECHGVLVTEFRRSPVRSPLRLRIAMGLIAAERSPHAYPTRTGEHISDHRWIIFIALGTFITMLLHLALIVVIAGFK